MLDLGFFPLILAALFLFSWGLRRHDPIEALALGAGFGVLGWGALALARFFVLLPSGWPRTIGLATLGLSVASTIILVRIAGAGQLQPGQPQKPLLVALSGVAILTLGLEATLPHYDVAARYYDWWMHFDLAGFYRLPTDFERVYEGGSVPARTPLFDLLGGLALEYLGNRFSVFQIFAAAVGWLWALPFALIARRLLRPDAPALVALLGLSPLVLHAHTFTWPKGLAAFLTLLALDRLLALREAPIHAAQPISLQLGLFSGAALMAHHGFVGYVLPLLAVPIWAAWRGRGSWARALGALLMFLLTALPWFAWAVAQYGWRRALFSYPQPATSAGAWIIDRLVNLATTVLPVSLPVNLLTGVLDPLQDYFLIYLGTAAGTLGVAFLVWALAAWLIQRQFPANAPTVVGFAMAGILGATILLPGKVEDAAGAAFVPGFVALTLIAPAARLPRALLLVAAVEMIALQLVLLVWLWSPAAAGGLNARLAQTHNLQFLAEGAWPAGVVLLLVGAAMALIAARPGLVVPFRQLVLPLRAENR